MPRLSPWRLVPSVVVMVVAIVLGLMLPRGVDADEQCVVDAPAAMAVSSSTSPQEQKTYTGRLQARERAQQQLELAQAFYKHRDFKVAEGILRECLQLDPLFPECHKLLGAALGQQGKGPAGAAEYDRFLELAPEHQQADKVRALLAAYRRL